MDQELTKEDYQELYMLVENKIDIIRRVGYNWMDKNHPFARKKQMDIEEKELLKVKLKLLIDKL